MVRGNDPPTVNEYVPPDSAVTNDPLTRGVTVIRAGVVPPVDMVKGDAVIVKAWVPSPFAVKLAAVVDPPKRKAAPNGVEMDGELAALRVTVAVPAEEGL